MRANSYVGRVIKIESIPEADRIESAEVVCGEGGKWAGVVKKGEFQTGATCAVFLPDALLPETPDFEFMRKSKFIVRQARFRGVRSEVLILPYAGARTLGQDLDAELGINKYQKPIDPRISGNPLGAFPSFIPKTDEPNFQGVPLMVEALQGKPYYITEKADGSSGTAFVLDGKLRVCSRNLELSDGENTAGWVLARKFDFANKIPEGMAIQFEMVGGKIQGNPMGIDGLDMRIFNLYSITEHRYLDYVDLVKFCNERGWPMVKVVDMGPEFCLDTAEKLQELARGAYANGKTREGIVVRPVVESQCRGERLSFKVINLDYKG